MTQTRVFDEHAGAYDAWFDTHPWVYQSELECVRALLPIGGEGVEIGVGSGRFAAELGIPRGIDPSDAMRALAEARGIEVVAGTAEALPLAADTLDFALMVTTVCFLDDVGRAFRETYRVVKPGGVLVVGFIDRSSPLGRQYERRKEASVFYRDAHFHTPDDLAGLMREAGFEDLTFCQTLFGDIEAMGSVDEVREGFGQGGFVVVRGMKSAR